MENIFATFSNVQADITKRATDVVKQGRKTTIPSQKAASATTNAMKRKLTALSSGILGPVLGVGDTGVSANEAGIMNLNIKTGVSPSGGGGGLKTKKTRKLLE